VQHPHQARLSPTAGERLDVFLAEKLAAEDEIFGAVQLRECL